MSGGTSVRATIAALPVAAATAAVSWATWREGSCRPLNASEGYLVLTAAGLAFAWAAYSVGPPRWRIPGRITLAIAAGLVAPAVSYAAVFVAWAANCAS
ncbi:MAG: hypothetical protein M3540_08255 [Actinomycetota bacterium]|nr:hypothetical protein [Actinomycetota bacterium]